MSHSNKDKSSNLWSAANASYVFAMQQTNNTKMCVCVTKQLFTQKLKNRTICSTIFVSN